MDEARKKGSFPDIIQINPMEQIQNTVPQNRASRKSRQRARSPPDPAPGAQIRGRKIPPSKQSNAARGSKRRGGQKCAEGVRRERRNRNRFHTLPCGRGQSIGRWCRAPHVVAACPACLPPCPRGPGERKEGRKLAAPAAAPCAVCGTGGGGRWGSRGPLPVSTRVVLRYFL